jgi:low temperature requirement protein LtrA
MVSQCFGALCTLGIVVIAILVITRRISLDDALKSIGKLLLLIVALYFAVCMLAGPVQTGFAALVTLLAKAVRWLVVAVVIVVLFRIIVRARASKESENP